MGFQTTGKRAPMHQLFAGNGIRKSTNPSFRGVVVYPIGLQERF